MLKRGDRAAADQLWDAYMRRLIGLARARLGGSARRAADEEDVALSAFDSFYRRAEAGQFARLSDRDDLWQVLVIITERKAIDLMRREGRKARGEGRVVSLAAADDRIADPGPTPEFAASIADEFRRLLESLGDDSLLRVALARMEGYTNREIAERLGCIEQTVERKLRSIRRIWTGRDEP
jgi:RNA polymerase sigma factor (sigma-70 family)